VLFGHSKSTNGLSLGQFLFENSSQTSDQLVGVVLLPLDSPESNIAQKHSSNYIPKGKEGKLHDSALDLTKL
jgi:hypothetical protein